MMESSEIFDSELEEIFMNSQSFDNISMNTNYQHRSRRESLNGHQGAETMSQVDQDYRPSKFKPGKNARKNRSPKQNKSRISN